jgi:hypothetical protein
MQNMHNSFSMCNLLEINKSVSDVVEQINDMQLILKGKLKLVTRLLPLPSPCDSLRPKPCPPGPPTTPCIAVFLAKGNHCWKNGALLALDDATDCATPIKLKQTPMGKLITLPCGKKYKIELSLKLQGIAGDSGVSVEVLAKNGCETVMRKKITSNNHQACAVISNVLEWELPISHDECTLHIRLASDENVKVEQGKISIEEMKY